MVEECFHYHVLGRRFGHFIVPMRKQAEQIINSAISAVLPDAGIVITKYDHVKGPIGNLVCYEAGHHRTAVGKLLLVQQEPM